MIEIAVSRLSKSYGVNTIFNNVSFELHKEDRLGLIGQNGTGKTSLMKILLGEESYEGDLFLRKGIKLSYLNQIPVYQATDLTIDVLYQAFKDVLSIKKKMNELEKAMATNEGHDLQQIINHYSETQHHFEVMGGYDIDEKLGRIITGLQLEELLHSSFSDLSGGEKTRVMLGKVLLESPDVLLLDEPTNHLDIQMVSWLEDYLHKYNGAAIIISHDRYFLDRVVNKIIELHPGGVELYLGNYSYYKNEKDRRFEEAMKIYNQQQKKIKSMEEQIKRYRIWGEMRDSNKMYRKAKELEKRLSKIDQLNKPTLDHKIKLNFEQEQRSGKRVYDIKEVSKSFDSVSILEAVNLEVLYQDCLTIIGKNGSGKSTLLKILKQELVPDTGTIKVGSRLNIGYLPQEITFDDENLSILETYQHTFRSTILQARSALAKILFTKDDVFKKVNVLSGGEKTRLKLLLLMDAKVNVLLLDEPTNHLDIESREILESSLLSFDGTIIVISHDRYFINQLANKIAEINHKQLKVYEGNYDDYHSHKAKEQEAVDTLKEIEHKKKETNSKRVENQVSIEKKIEDLQHSIEIQEKMISDIELRMNQFGEDLDQLQKLYEEKELVEMEMDSLYQELEQYI